MSFNLNNLSSYASNDQWYINYLLDELKKNPTRYTEISDKIVDAINNANRRLEIQTNYIHDLQENEDRLLGRTRTNVPIGDRTGLRYRGSSDANRGNQFSSEDVELREIHQGSGEGTTHPEGETSFTITESTPLIPGSGSGFEAVAGASGATAGTSILPSTAGGAVVAGAGGAAIVVGAVKLLKDVLSNKEYTAPNHYFLGPGNDANRPENPVDLDDQIAKEHDIAYENAKTREDISKADDVAISDFVADAHDNHNVHSVVGAVGLKAKQALESVVGPVYPSMSAQPPARTTGSRNRDSSVEDRLRQPYDPKAPFGKDKNGRPLTYNQFVASVNTYASNKTRGLPIQQIAAARQRHIERIHNQLITQWGKAAYVNFFKDPKRSNDFHLGRTTDLGLSSSTESSVPRPVAPQPGPSSGSKRPSDSVIEQPPTKNRGNNPPIANSPQSPITQRRHNPSSDEEISRPSSAAAIPSDVNRGSAQNSSMPDTEMRSIGTSNGSNRDGGNPASGGSGISDAVLQYYRSKGLQYHNGKFIYENSFRMRSWGNALYRIAGSTTVRHGVLTPYVSLPNDHLGLYMPFSAYNVLPLGTMIDKLSVKVTPIGQMVSFNTNSSASSVGTTAHTLYGAANIGLNKVLPIGHYTITRNSANAMTIDSATPISSQQTFCERLWGEWDVNSPRASLHEIINPHAYLTVYDVNAMTPPQSNAIDPGVSNNAIMLNQHLTKFPMQPHTGTPIINFSYDMKGVKIKPRNVFNANYKDDYVLYTRPESTYKNIATKFDNGIPEAATATSIAQPTTLQELGFNPMTTMNAFYARRLNTIASFDGKGKVRDIIEDEIPGIFFGIEAVKSNTPETNADYINASCDFYIETSIELSMEAHLPFTNSLQLLPYQLDSYLLQNRPAREYTVPSMFGLVTRKKPATAILQENMDELDVEDSEEDSYIKVNAMKPSVFRFRNKQNFIE